MTGDKVSDPEDELLRTNENSSNLFKSCPARLELFSADVSVY